jgi:transposase
VLGHALSRQAIHGGQAKNDKIDAQKSAVFLRGGRLPQASVSPAAMRATRARRRRRTPVRRQRAEWLAHLHNTTRQYHLPEIGKKSASKANRDGVAERLPEPAVHQRSAGALALMGHYAQLRRAVELSIRKTAKPPQAQPLYLRRPVPGIGALLRRVLRYASQDIARCPRVQAFLSSCRLVQCTRESAGKRSGTAGTKIGNAHLTWACSEAAGLFLRENPAGPKSLTTPEKKHGSGQALPLLAQTRGRAVSDMVRRHTAVARGTLLHGSGSGADEPHASLDHHGRRLRVVLCHVRVALRHGTRRSPEALWPGACGLCLAIRSGSWRCGARRVQLTWAAPPPSLRRTGERHPCSHPCA